MLPDRIIAGLLAFALVWFPPLAFAQSAVLNGFPPGVFQNRAAMDAPVSAPYTGPGDVVSGATFWGSCARVYNAASASTSTSLCDLVSSSAPTTVLCTLRGTSAGTVDLTAYCTGLVTPAALCALQTGGVCNVSQIYDQSGSGHPVSITTAANQPVLSFSLVNGLPGPVGSNANGTVLVSAGNVLPASAPYTETAVYERTGSFTTSLAAVGFTGTPATIGPNSSANSARLNTPSGTITATANDSAFHVVQGVFATGTSNSILNVDGTSTTGTTTPSTIAVSIRMFTGNGSSSITGPVMEGGFWPLAFTTGNLHSMCLNMTGAYGLSSSGC